MSNSIPAMLKALVGALIAGLGSLYQALDNGTVTAQEWTAIAIATLAALGIVWGVPNLDPRGQRQDESVQPPVRTERGDVPVVTAILVVLLVVVVLVFLVPAIR